MSDTMIQELKKYLGSFSACADDCPIPIDFGEVRALINRIESLEELLNHLSRRLEAKDKEISLLTAND